MKKELKDNSTILVAMSGRVDSAVAAYLLKRQGYNVIGLGITFFDREINFPEEELSGQGCHVDELSIVKNVCEKIGIPFYGVNGAREFNETVMQKLTVNKLSGKSFSPCVYCNSMKIKILCEKAEKLGADFIATGHYVKKLKSNSTKECSLTIPGEERHDQTYLLADVKKEFLLNMLFPLSDISREEVVKLGKKILPDVVIGNHERVPCFINDPNLYKYIERTVGSDLLKKGSIIKMSDNASVGDHDGIHGFYLGQKKIVSTVVRMPIDNNLIVTKLNVKRAEVILGYLNDLASSTALIKCEERDNINYSSPKPVYIRVGQRNIKYKGKIYYKVAGYAVLEFDEALTAMNLGEMVAVFDSKIRGGKFIVSGTLENIAPVEIAAAVNEKPEKSDEILLEEDMEKTVEVNRFYL